MEMAVVSSGRIISGTISDEENSVPSRTSYRVTGKSVRKIVISYEASVSHVSMRSMGRDVGRSR